MEIWVDGNGNGCWFVIVALGGINMKFISKFEVLVFWGW